MRNSLARAAVRSKTIVCARAAFQARYRGRPAKRGGLLFAIGAVLLLSRKPGHREWSHLGRFLIVFMPAVGLYVLALGKRERSHGQDPGPWQSVLAVTAILLI